MVVVFPVDLGSVRCSLQYLLQLLFKGEVLWITHQTPLMSGDQMYLCSCTLSWISGSSLRASSTRHLSVMSESQTRPTKKVGMLFAFESCGYIWLAQSAQSFSSLT